MAKMVMPHLPSYLHPPVFWFANVAFTIFVICLLLSIYISATLLQGANLGKSIFSSSEYIIN